MTPIDFRRSLPPIPPDLHDHLARAFGSIAEKRDLGRLTHQSIPRGAEADRIAGGRMMESRLNERVDPSRLIVTNGTQSAVLILLRMLVGPGELMVAERLSYGPLRLLADIAGARLVGLDIDDHGILPDSFEAVCRSAKPRALYCNPTVQNPTTAIMPEPRRMAIAETARRHGVAIIEDDALGRLHADAPKPIATFAPDVTWYVMSTTKCLMHGLRLAYLVAPSAEAADRVIGPVEHLSYWHPAPLLAAVVTEWVDSGVADQISLSIARECLARETVAREILADLDLRSQSGSMHIWLNLPAHWDSRDFMRVAEQRGVLLRSADLFAVDGPFDSHQGVLAQGRPFDSHDGVLAQGRQRTPNAVRLSLSTPDTIDDVRRGLERLRAILDVPVGSR